MTDSPICIILVEDDKDLQETINRFLTQSGYKVAVAETALQFYQKIEIEHYNVAIIDIGLPDESGLVLAEYLRNNTDMGILILTARGEIDMKVQGYMAGADLFLVKPVILVELAAAIKSIAQRSTERQHTQSASARSWSLERSTWQLISPEGVTVKLTGKEFDLLLLLAKKGGELVCRKEITAALNYSDYLEAGRALDNLVRRIRKKVLDFTGNDELIHTFHSQGFCISNKVLIR